MYNDSRKVSTLFNPSPGIYTQWSKGQDNIPSGVKHYFTKYSGIVGIELEIERFHCNPGSNIGRDEARFWTRTGDDSLKDSGIELISTPVQGPNIDYALLELEDILTKQTKQVHYFNHRCSMHVHINVSNLEMGQLHKLYVTYAMLEPYFFAWCDKDRRNNTFCVPLYIQQANWESLFVNLNTKESKRALKYLALANNHLEDYGTIEFRHMHGTKDMKLIRRWITMIQKLFKYATNERNPTPVPYETDTQDLAQRVFNTLLPVIPPYDSSTMPHATNAAYLLTI